MAQLSCLSAWGKMFACQPVETAPIGKDAVQPIRFRLACHRGYKSHPVLKTTSQLSGPPVLQALIGESEAMVRLKRQIEKAGPSAATVLIHGESGAGKEGVAQALHELRFGSGKPYVTVNCGAIAANLIESELLGHEKGSFTGAERQRAGYFEAAHGGSLFLDEVTEMPLAMQVKLLRVLETKRFQRVGGSEELSVEVRVIAATNRDIQAEVRAGRFREDLLYRLAVVSLHVPPLRQRAGDAVLLAQHFLGQLNQREKNQKRFSASCLQQLANHRWPGNVRELKNAVSRAFILADAVIELPLEALLARSRPRQHEDKILLTVGSSLEQSQRALIEATLKHCGDDKLRAAEMLGISLKTLYNRLESYRG